MIIEKKRILVKLNNNNNLKLKNNINSKEC